MLKDIVKEIKKYIKRYDANKPSKFITYLDTNNLYGWAMSQYLSYNWYKWLNKKKIDKLCLNEIVENTPIGYILEIDLENPNKLHGFHNGYPLARNKLEINHNILSNYCSVIANVCSIKNGGVNKLVRNLDNKKKYVLNYKNFQLDLWLEIKLVKVHKILNFNNLIG